MKQTLEPFSNMQSFNMQPISLENTKEFPRDNQPVFSSKYEVPQD